MTLGYSICYGDKIEIDATNGRLEIFYNREDAEKYAAKIEKEIGNSGAYEVKEYEIRLKQPQGEWG